MCYLLKYIRYLYRNKRKRRNKKHNFIIKGFIDPIQTKHALLLFKHVKQCTFYFTTFQGTGKKNQEV